MSVSNPSGATATPFEPSLDIQQLIALLGGLMPLLLRFQSQTVFQPRSGFSGFALPDPALDQQAAANLASDITANSLRNLSAYLEVHAGQHAGLENCIPLVTQAARSFAMHNYAQALNLIWEAYRVIAMVRAVDPQLPPLQAGGPIAAAPSGATPPTPPSIH
jgi:hypothetical protein